MLDPDGRIIEYGEYEFRKFIEDPLPDGLDTPFDEAKAILGDSPIRIAFEEAATRAQGSSTAWREQPRVEGNRFAPRNPNHVRVTEDGNDGPDVEASPPAAPDPQVGNRDRSKEPQAGNSLGYAVRRLGRENPELLEKVRSGEMKAHRAMILAGLKPDVMTIPVIPKRMARLIAKRLTPEQRREFALVCLVSDAEHSARRPAGATDNQTRRGLDGPWVSYPRLP
jgi:hypothetical protein